MRVFHSERLRVPGSWWLVGMFFTLTFVAAVAVYIGPQVVMVAVVVAAVGVAAVLLWYGNTRIVVDEAGLHAAGSLLEWEWIGAIGQHDRDATRARLGAGADPAAWLVVRGYVPDSVEVAVADPDDPHPYWLVSTRRAADLAAALGAGRAAWLESRG